MMNATTMKHLNTRLTRKIFSIKNALATEDERFFR